MGSETEDPDATGNQAELTLLSLWSIATIDLGISERRFWNLTLREFDALVERRHVMRRLDVDIPHAHLCSLLANIYRNDKEHPEPFSINDFTLWPSEPRPAPLTKDQQLIAKLKGLTLLMGGDVNL